MSGARRLVVVRHGRTAWNAEGRFQGQADVPLDDVGQAQAAALVAELAALQPERVATSDLSRTRQTAAPLAAATGIEPLVDPRLREVDVGAWEGLTADEVRARFPEQFEVWRSGQDLARGGGETAAAGGRRAVAAILEHLSATRPGRVLVVVSHGLVLRAALEELRRMAVVDVPSPVAPFANAAWLDLAAEVPAG